MTEPASTNPIDPKDHTVAHVDPWQQRIWDYVSASPLGSLWDLQGVPARLVAQRTWNSFLEDNLLSRAAELGFYFLFALFPTLVCASAVLGLAARSAAHIYLGLLHYLALVIPPAALNIVMQTFNQTTAASSSGKLTFGLVAALWSASVGFSAIQDTLNVVYKVKETRSYFGARASAILVTMLLAVVITLLLTSLLGGDYFARVADRHIVPHWIGMIAVGAIHTVMWAVTWGLATLVFALIYYFAPDLKQRRWHWFTPGAAVGLLGWLLISLGLRVYLHYFDTYSLTYGSLGAVIVLLTWFYITGVMLLLGAEINSEIEASAAELRLKTSGDLPPQATTDHKRPIAA